MYLRNFYTFLYYFDILSFKYLLLISFFKIKKSSKFNNENNSKFLFYYKNKRNINIILYKYIKVIF